MSRQQSAAAPGQPFTGDERARLFAGAPVIERRLVLGGVSTAVLEGGVGPSIILLHGQGGFAGMWLPVLADLVRTHRVVAPDLPGLALRSRPTVHRVQKQCCPGSVNSSTRPALNRRCWWECHSEA